MENIDISLKVPPEAKGERLDKWLAEQLADYSRSRIQQWIVDDAVQLDGKVRSAGFKLKGGEALRLTASWEPAGQWQAEPGIDLDVRYEDEDLLIINKQADIVTHPGAGNRNGTLANALLDRYPKLAQVTRAGIVHRLDKGTSGVMMVAHSEAAYQNLVAALRQRQVSRRYTAVLEGRLLQEVKVDEPVGRHSHNRTLMAVTKAGLQAVTHIKPLELFAAATLVEASLETGRTHQIRVHAAHINHSVLGDSQYRHTRGMRLEFGGVVAFPRQALHAEVLALTHPTSGKPCEFNVEQPDDLTGLISALRADALTTTGDS